MGSTTTSVVIPAHHVRLEDTVITPTGAKLRVTRVRNEYVNGRLRNLRIHGEAEDVMVVKPTSKIEVSSDRGPTTKERLAR
jgi:hypothetical protein